MSKKNFSLLFFLTALCGPAFGQTPSIEGVGVMKTDETQTFSVPADAAVEAYHWQAPNGCRVTQGQGTNSVEITSSWLARSGQVCVERTFADGHRDTLSSAVEFMPYVKEVKDYTIAPGGSVSIGGVERSEADIYYTPAEGSDYQVVATG